MDKEQIKTTALIIAAFLAAIGAYVMITALSVNPPTIIELRNIMVGVGTIALSLFVLKAGDMLSS